MFSDFKQLKKSSSIGTLTQKLIEHSEKLSKASSAKDDRIFSVERDKKTGTGFAIVRFMPPPPNEPSSCVQIVNHNFNYNGKYLNENCPNHTPGITKRDCPICDSNRELWATGVEANKQIASLRKLRTSYYTNVYIVKNPSNPELEGRVMLYRFGVKLFEKIENARKEKYEGDTNVIEPYDLFDSGANFRIVVKTQVDSKNNKEFPEYSESGFESKGVLFSDDTRLEAVWRQCHSLQELISPEKFRSYEDIEKNLRRVMGVSANSVQAQEAELEEVVQAVNDDAIMSELEAHYKSKNNPLDEENSSLEDALKAFEELDMDD